MTQGSEEVAPLAMLQHRIAQITGGEDAQGEVTVKVRFNDRFYNGHGLSTDVVEASIRAYLSAINALLGDAPATGEKSHAKS